MAKSKGFRRHMAGRIGSGRAFCGMTMDASRMIDSWDNVNCGICLRKRPKWDKPAAVRTPPPPPKAAAVKPKPRRAVERYSWWEWQRLSLDKKEQCIREWAKIPAGYYRGE